MSVQLSRAIEKVQSEIANYSEVLQQNEYQTVQSLVNPVLNALGWRVNEVARVRQQYRVGRGKVDMALMRDDKPVVLVEAKALGTDFDDAVIDQVSQYCYREGASTALLTNGAEWRVYRPLLMKLTFEQRMLFRLRLDQQDDGKAVEKLSLLARDEIDRLEKEDLQILLDAYWSTHARDELLAPFAVGLREALVKWSNKPQGEIPSREVSAWLRKKMFAGSKVVTDNGPPPPPPPSPPTIVAIELNGEHFQIRYVRDVLVHTAEWLIQRGRLQRHDCPVRLGSGQRYLVHTISQHSNGSPFAGPKHLSNGLFLEANFSARDVVRYARLLLEHCGYRPASNTLRIIER